MILRLVLVQFILVFSTLAQAEAPNPHIFALNKLMAENFSEDFVKLASANQEDTVRDRIAKLNMLGFMLRADYSVHYSKQAVKKCRNFMAKHKTQLERAEKRFGVPKEVITSLLWVETKHGKLLGRYNIATVFFYILQLDHPELIEMNFHGGQSIKPPEMTDAQLRAKILERAKTKTDWAMDELRALNKLYLKSPKRVIGLRGSFGGAFGIPQFLPSSYVRWSASSHKGREADLSQMNDAIFSVASYLNANGWKKTKESHKASLFHYNRSEGYVNVILKIAKELEN